jgi:regulatory protein
MLKDNSMSAMGFALKLLGLRSHSMKELEQKLQKKGYTVENIEPVLEKLTMQGVLDDRMFGIELIKSRSRRKPSGKLKIGAELRKKGVPDSIIGELLNDYDSGELCYRAAEKKISSLHGATEECRKKKLEVFLYNRGFDWHDIRVVITQFFTPGRDDENAD